ncbi:uncharacterized protein LOC107461311 [Arachis duranensis]|uniref:Uncharacterized protein LOC107461311 n=1 Tax=Arachis duranensis TaxID=130453 RepID=A0A6P4C1B2_ARADU|nr:uncharacterized protein LOC107461311 [Arachis duranensis]
MAKKIDSLQVAAVNTSQPSTKWGQNEENQEDQQQEQPQYVHNQSPGQNDVYGDTHNPSWKNHPNIRWGDNHTQNQQPWQRNSNQNNSRNNQNYNQQNINPNPYRKPQNNHSNSSYCPPNNQTTNQNTHHQPSTPHNQPQTSQDTQRISNLETLIEKMMKHQETMMEKLMKNQEMAKQDQEAAWKDQAITIKNQEAAIRNLERHMEQMAKQNTEMGEKQLNASPSTTSDHPRDKGKATKWEECKAIMVGGEKEAINQEEHNRKVPQEETEERSEEERKTKNAKSSKRDKDILETQLQEKKERVKPHIPKLPYPWTAIKSQYLADFIAEYTNTPEIPSMWNLYVDGSSNKIGSRVGVIIESNQGTQIELSLKFEFSASNYQAEYEALLAGLKLAKEVRAQKLVIFSDSQVITSQITGTYQAKDPAMKKYLYKTRE